MLSPEGLPLLQRKVILTGILLLSLSVSPTLLDAQDFQDETIELIVRPVDDAPETFLRRLRSPTIKTGTDSLFAGVVASRATFRTTGSLDKAGRGSREPIPAQTLTVRDSAALRRVRTRMAQRSEVEYVQANVEFSVEGASEPVDGKIANDDSPLDSENIFADSLDHLSVIRAISGWDVTAGSGSVSVGVVDTGIYFKHPDLAQQFRIKSAEDADGNGRFGDEDLDGTDADGNGYADDVIGYDFVDRPNVFVEGDFTERDADPSPDLNGRFSGHGTAVAGLIGAAAADPKEGMVGVAPHTSLVALRAFGGDGRGRTDDIAAAIVYGAQENLDVLNLSFGRSRAAPLLEEAIEYAVDQGTVVVASAGNEGAIDDPHYPSDYPETISVMWLAEDGDDIPEFSRSQHGIGVDLGAPGSSVFTTQFPRVRLRNDQPVRRTDLYGSSSGSSFSAPQGAGAAALLRAVDSTLSPIAIRSILTATAADIRGVSWDHTTGAGRLDVRESLLRSYPAQTELHSPEHNEGFTGDEPIPVVGTALDPSFQSFTLYYAKGTRNLDRRSDPWTPITQANKKRVHRDTLATWDVSSLSEGAYTLRLVTTLSDQRTVEDRRRVVIDRSPPTAEVKVLDAGRFNGHWAVLADVASDDTVRSRMTVNIRGKKFEEVGEFEASRQALNWTDESGLGGPATVEIVLTNRSGLRTRLERSVSIPADQTNAAFFDLVETTVPRGHLLPEPADLDGDDLPEIVLNQFEQGALSDSVRAFEWGPNGFVSSDTLLARLFPKDIGDTNRDGRRELLLQVRGATILLEQTGSEGLPKRLVYADTSGAAPSEEGPAVHGAVLSNLDGDRWGEIVGNWKPPSGRTRWRVLEREGDTFEQITEVENPTVLERSDTLRSSPEAVTGDFDGDGQRDLLVGDRDGNWIVYESDGADQLDVAWTHETDRFRADTRFAVGDVTGDGREEFVTHSTFDPLPLDGGEFEAPITVYHVWSAVADDTYERLYALPIWGQQSNRGAVTTGDFDSDNRDEVAIANPPSLMLLDQTNERGIEVVYDDRTRPSVLTSSLVSGDFTGDGIPSLIAATTGDRLRRYVVNHQAVRNDPPRWVKAVPGGASSTRLSWRAEGSDSVTVYAGPVDGTLDPVTIQRDSSVTISGTSKRRYALRAWTEGVGSPLSPERVVRPHMPATVRSIEYPGPAQVRLRFTEPLDPSLRADQFKLASGRAPESILLSSGDTGVVIRFGEGVAGTTDRLEWRNVKDRSGLSVGQSEVGVRFPARSNRTLFVEDVDILTQQRVRLTFNEPLNGEAAREVRRYDVQPHGVVESVAATGPSPDSVTIHLDGIVVGATGQEVSLRVESMRSARGAQLVSEGSTIRLTRPADDLQNVFVYPNPIRPARHDPRLTIAGLPSNATVQIFSPAGRLVDVLSVENSRSGGVRWDLRNRRGRRVPSGIYLVRVEAPDASPVLKKAAVIR